MMLKRENSSDVPLALQPHSSISDTLTGSSHESAASVHVEFVDVEKERPVVDLRRRTRSGDSFYSEVVHQHVPEEPYGWVIVFAVFMIHVVVDGVSSSFGILYPHLQTRYSANVAEITFCSSVLYGVTYGCGPLASQLCDEFGLRSVALVGALLAFSGFVISIFAQDLWQLTISYGVITGLGFGFMYLPAIVSVSSWFEERRAIATAIAVCGNGIGVFIVPPLTAHILEEYTLFGTMLLISGMVLNGLIFAALLRTPPRHRKVLNHSHLRVQEKKKPEFWKNLRKQIAAYFRELDWTLMRNWKFLIYALASFLGALTCYVPLAFIATRASQEAGVDERQASFLYSYMGMASIAGRLTSGVLSDRKVVDNLLLYSGACILSGVGTSVSVFWDDYFANHVVYALIFGSTSGVIVALQSVVLVDLVGVKRISSAFGILLFVQGVAVFVGQPFAGLIIETFGGTYTFCFVIVGAVMSCSGLALLIIPLKTGFCDVAGEAKR